MPPESRDRDPAKDMLPQPQLEALANRIRNVYTTLMLNNIRAEIRDQAGSLMNDEKIPDHEIKSLEDGLLQMGMKPHNPMMRRPPKPKKKKGGA